MENKKWEGQIREKRQLFLFIYFRLHWVFFATRGFSLVVVPRLSYPVACGSFPGPETKSIFPVLAGGFLSTGPPMKS